MRKEHRPWTDEELHRVLELKRQKLSDAKIGKILGRTGPAIAQKISTYEQKEIRRSAAWALDFGHIKLSEQQLAERDARLEASYLRDETAERMGDPPPGYSARDRRGQCQS